MTGTDAPAAFAWRRAGTGFPGAPAAAEQPAPVPSGPSRDGTPYTTPWVKAVARARGVDLDSVRATGNRITVADLPPEGRVAEELPPVRAGAERPPATWHSCALDADVTRLWRALADRAATPVRTAVLARVVARQLSLHDGVTAGPEAARPRLGVRVGEDHGIVVLPDAHHLSLSGLLRQLLASVSADIPEEEPQLLLTDSGPDGPTWEISPPPGAIAVSLTAGSVVRRVQVVATDDGESIGVAAVMHLVLCHDERVRRGDAIRLLRAVRDDLEAFDPAVLGAELLADHQPGPA